MAASFVKIHGTVVPEGKLKDIKETVLYWVSTMQSCLPADAAEKLLALVQAVPHDNHMIHGDYHTKNIELQNDEVLLIDMDTLSVGNPVFEFAHIYNSLIGFSEWDHEHASSLPNTNVDIREPAVGFQSTLPSLPA